MNCHDKYSILTKFARINIIQIQEKPCRSLLMQTDKNVQSFAPIAQVKNFDNQPHVLDFFDNAVIATIETTSIEDDVLDTF